MISLCFSIPPITTHTTSLINHPKPFSLIPYSPADQIKKNKNISNMMHSLIFLSKSSKILAANANTATDGRDGQREYQNNLPDGLQPELMPKHVAVIMDGNRRWAAEKGLAAEHAYRAGFKILIDLTRACSEWGIGTFSAFGFSNENWMRSQEEVDILMSVFEEQLQSDLEEYWRNGIRVSIIGDKAKLPDSLQKVITRVEETTKNNTKQHFMMAWNYGGQQDILEATKNIANKLKDGVIQLEDINKSLFANELQTKFSEFPNPDLLIRTSGEQRVSNFMLWQLAYTEIFFVEKRFPEFEEADLITVLKSFQRRHRRFGGHKY